MRLAYLRVAEPSLQALLRSDPELAAQPLIVTDGKERTPSVIAVNSHARTLGARVGLTVAQARAVAPELVVRARSPALERAAQDALEDLAASFSPRLELRAPGEIVLDVGDLGRLFDGEEQIAAALWTGARKLGLDAQVGIAGNRETARIAATLGEDVQVVPPGREAAFLARLPVALLQPGDEAAVNLSRWGVRTIGELASLPARGLGLRLGVDGVRLARVARGEADDPLVPRPDPVVFEEGVDLEWPVDNVEALLFVSRRLVDHLLERLSCRALAVDSLELILKLDRAFVDASARAGAALDVRKVVVGAATREAATLLTLTRVALESEPPRAPVTTLIVRAHPAHTRAAQLGLFEPSGPSPDKLATLLARLHALAGEGRVGAPALVDRHLPDAFGVEPFQPPPAGSTLRAPAGSTLRAPADSTLRAPSGTRRLALHAFRPPRSAEARLDRGRIRYLAAEGLAGQVIQSAGPFRVRDGWWQSPVDRDYFDVELSDGAFYRIFQDRRTGTWHVDGCYE
jgi:protein ImuB